MLYKNLSNSVKTFYGVTFKPGEVHEVSGTINHKDFYKVSPESVEKPKKQTRQSSKKQYEAPVIDEANTETVKPQAADNVEENESK